MQTNPRLAGPDVTVSEEVPAILRFRRERTAPVRPVQMPRWSTWYLRTKAVADFVLAALIAVPALPVVLLSALAIKLTSRGPAFYSQTRVGRGGRQFTILKLRTMIHNCESLTGPRWSMPGDPRITPLGWFLRKSHLDELPQLLNVLRGEMSLIGPRPERPEFVPELERTLPAYRQRLLVRPGVTGLAQVQLPPDTDLESVRMKLTHDFYYIQNMNPWLDLKLLLATGFYALGVPARLFTRLLGIPGTPRIEQQMREFVGQPLSEAGSPPRGRLAA